MTNETQTEILENPSLARSDLALLRRGIAGGWDIPEQLLTALPRSVARLALDPEQSAVVRLKAVETILRMKSQNDAMISPPQQVDHRHTHELAPVTAENFEESKRKLAERIARLGRNS